MRSDFLLNRQAVDIWQHQVENHDVDAALVENVKRREAILRFDNTEAGETERRTVHSPDIGIVFDDKYSVAGVHAAILKEGVFNDIPNRKLGCSEKRLSFD